MSRREVTIERTQTIAEYTCDRCGKVMSSRRQVCQKCGRDLCSKCSMLDHGEMGDYPPAYCRACWDRGASYRALVEANAAQDEEAEEKWKQACIDARKAEEATAEKAKES